MIDWYGLGWAFFVSDSHDYADFNSESESFALGWLAAAADYADLASFDNLRDFVILTVERYQGRFSYRTADKFWLVCVSAIKNSRSRGEFVRLPFKFDN